jgi:hypothetical protein
MKELRQELREEMKELRQDIRALDQRLSKAMVWAVLLYAGLAGSLFYVLARGFKWI